MTERAARPWRRRNACVGALLFSTIALSCATAEELEKTDSAESAQGGSRAGFGGAYAARSSGGGGGGAALSRGGGSGGKESSGGTLGAGGVASRGGSSPSSPSEGGQAGSVSSGTPSCHFTGGAGAGGETGTASGGESSGAGGTGDVGSAGSVTGSGAGEAGAGGAGSESSPFAFCDDFNDGDAGGWDPDSCPWSVVEDDSLAYESGGGTCLSSVGPRIGADQVLEARVKVVRFGGTSSSYRAGIFARSGGSSNYYALTLAGDGSLRLLRGTSSLSGSGQCSDLNANLAIDTWYSLRLEVSGPMNNVRVRGYIDGALSHDCLLTNNTQVSGGAGVITTGSDTLARFDDFRVFNP